MHVVTDGLEGYFVTHICYGAFQKIYPGMLDIPVDNFDLEMSNNQLSLLDLFRRNRFTKDISFGVVDVHSHEIEDRAEVKERLRRALEVLEPEQIWVDPDCGLKTRTEEETIQKLKVMRAAVEEVRLKTNRRAKRKGKKEEL